VVTPLETFISITSNEKAGVEPIVTDQQLVGVSTTHGSHAIPQSISASSLLIVSSGRYGHLGTSFKVGLTSSLVVNEDYFCELKQ